LIYKYSKVKCKKEELQKISVFKAETKEDRKYYQNKKQNA